jgi:hypothetical protein
LEKFQLFSNTKRTNFNGQKSAAARVIRVVRVQKAFCFDAARMTLFSVRLKAKDIDITNLKMFNKAKTICGFCAFRLNR